MERFADWDTARSLEGERSRRFWFSDFARALVLVGSLRLGFEPAACRDEGEQGCGHVQARRVSQCPVESASAECS